MSNEYKSIVILSILLVESVIFGVWKSNQVNKLSDKMTLTEIAVEQAASDARRAKAEAIRQEALAIAEADKLRKALENCK